MANPLTTVHPGRGRCLVRKIETPESLPGAKVVLLAKTREEMTAQQAEIVSVGAPALCEDEEGCERPHPMTGHLGRKWYNQFHVFGGKPGDWVLLAPRSLTEFPDGTYLVWQDDVLAVLSQ